MTTRQYSSRSQQSTLTGAVTAGATSITVVSGTTLLGGVTIPAGRTFTLVIDPDTALEEIVDATAVSTNTFTITRAIDGSTAQSHSAGAVVRHMAIGRDLRDANLHAEATGSYNDGSGNAHTMHGIAAGEGDVVGTAKTQTLTNKTLTAPTISDPVITGVIGGAGITFEGSTADAHETTLTVADPTQDNTITLPNTTGTVVIADATQTLTNKTLTSPTISGSPVITGLSSAGMVASSATPKDYVDSILGSATAAATSAASAATSASSAATSASSASTSASSALTSANSASTSATAAATSASSAATSASSAATSASNADVAATSSSVSATAASTSASSASTSASSALTSANSASTSASSALTSANSAATSASSAATSYDSFDDRYLGAKASPPTVDNDGNALLTGALYWNTGSNQMFVWGGSAWSEISSTAQIFRYKFTAAGGETSESGVDDNGNTLSYLVGKEQVYLNGALLARGDDYTATNGTSISGLSPALSSGDVLEVITFSAFVLATAITNSSLEAKGDLISASTAGTLARVALGTNEQRLVVDTATTSGLKYVSDTTNYAVAAKGDLLAGSAADTVTALTVGSNGDTLVADSSQTTGLRYNPPVGSLANPIINGGFDIWQRGTSFTAKVTGTNYGADRWDFYSANTSNIASRETTGDTTNLPNIQYCLRAARPSGNTGTDFIYLNTSVESVNAIPFAGKSITLSFYARAGANYSAASGNLNVRLDDGTGTDQRMVNGYTGGSQRINQNVVLTTTWQRFALTGSIRSTATEFGFWFSSAPTGTAGAADYFEVTGVQIDVGTYTASTAPTFRRAGGTIQGELAACERYFQTIAPTGNTKPISLVIAYTSTAAYGIVPMRTTMRSAPTIYQVSGTNYFVLTGNNDSDTFDSITALGETSPQGVRLDITSGIAMTQGYGYWIRTNNTNAMLALQAEL